MKTFTYRVTDPLGMHARPAGLFVKEAVKYNSSIELVKGDKRGDGKKIFAVMGLAVKSGEEITVNVAGDDEEAAYNSLSKFIKENL